MAKANLTKEANIDVAARELDFVTRFGANWEHLMDLLGIMRPIKKQPGFVLKSKKASVTLSSSVGEGEEIPYSVANVVETPYAEMTVEKYAKAVSIETIKTYGYDVAVAMTDEAFLNELQANVTGRFYTYLNGGSMTGGESTWQATLAMAKGTVLNKFKKMHKSVTKVVGFANVLDLYAYLGAADITVQNAFGFNYIQNFLGYDVLFLLSDAEIARGRVIATPVENIVLYYIDPGDSDFAKAGLEYTVQGQTNLLGFHTEGNYHNAVSESFAIMGLTLFAEYLDGVAVFDVGANAPKLSALTLGTLTLSPAFDPNIIKYATTTTNASNAITATAASGVTVAITANGTSVDSGSSATWTAGENTVVITATKDGLVKTYTVTVVKQ